MFENVSDKIKIVAKTTFILGMIASIIGGITMIVVSATNSTSGLIAGGIFLMLLGPFVFYALSLLIYCFGEIAEKTCNISNSLCSSNTNDNEKTKKAELNKYLITVIFN